MPKESGYKADTEQVLHLAYAAVCLALCMVLPFITGQIPEIGKALSPMHIPVFLCGFMCGWPWAMAVGAVAPLLRGAVFGMPVLFPGGIAMAFEMATYGLVVGILYRLFPKKTWSVYVVLIIAMLCGRLVWGLARFALTGINQSRFTFDMFLSGAFVTAVPAIILHIALVPVLVILLRKAKVIH